MGDGEEEPLSEPAPRRPDSVLALSGRRMLEAVAETVSGQPAQPEQLGPYRVSKALGRGAFGEVYLGFDPELERSVALKLLRNSATDDATDRLRKEARAMAALNHPALLTVYGFGEFESRVYIAMEYAEQGTLRDWLVAEPRSTEAVVGQIARAARGLHAAHTAGFVHRDVKPSNILIGADGMARVSDFGLVYAEGSTTTTVSSATATSLQTAMGGTPPYMAPELFDPSPPSSRSDEFALGVTMFEALFDRRPKWQQMVIEGVEIPAARQRPESPVPRWLRDVLLRALATDPDRRFGSLQVLADALEAGLGRGQRRRRAGIGAATLVVAAGVGWGVRSPEGSEACTGWESALDDVWDDARSRATKDVILESGLPFATKTWASVRGSIDAYATTWLETRRQACVATAVRHERSPELMDKAMACLAGRRRALEAFVSVLGEGRTDAIVAAPLAARDLPEVSGCFEVDRLLTDLAPPPADDVEEVELLGDRIARAEALRVASAYAEAGALLDEARPRVEALAYAPLRQDFLLARSKLAAALMDLETEHDSLLQAYAGASSSGRSALAGESALRLAVALSSAGEHDAGARWLRLAEAAANDDDDPAWMATLWRGRGDIAQLAGDPETAVPHYREAVAVLEQAFGVDDIRLVTPLRNLGNALSDAGDYEATRAAYRRALELARLAYGEQHPTAADVLTNLGGLACAREEHAECDRVANEALAIHEATLGPDHPSVADDTTLLGLAAAARGDYARALAHFERADTIYAANEGTRTDAARLAVLDGLSNLQLTTGDTDGAADYAQRSLDVARSAYPAGHRRIALALSNLALIRNRQGRFEDALTLLAEADAIQLRRFGVEHPDRIPLLSVRNATLMYLDRYDEAIAVSKTQLGIIERKLGADHVSRAQPLYNIAFSLELLGRHAPAEPVYRESLAVIEAAGDANAPTLVYPLVGLARTLTASERAAEAVPLAERALRVAKGHAQLEADAQAALARALVLSGADRQRARTLADEAAATFEALGGATAASLEELNVFRREHDL
ncbi:MAG: serine/threonine-protein kinase [Myxococcota bacterium]